MWQGGGGANVGGTAPRRRFPAAPTLRRACCTSMAWRRFPAAPTLRRACCTSMAWRRFPAAPTRRRARCTSMAWRPRARVDMITQALRCADWTARVSAPAATATAAMGECITESAPAATATARRASWATRAATAGRRSPQGMTAARCGRSWSACWLLRSARGASLLRRVGSAVASGAGPLQRRRR